MPRPRHRAVAPARHFDLLWALRTGLCDGDGFSDEDLRVGWDVYGEALMEERHAVGTRPWGWWAFVVGEPGRNRDGTRRPGGSRTRMPRRFGWRSSGS